MYCGDCNWQAEPGIAMKNECAECGARLRFKIVEAMEATWMEAMKVVPRSSFVIPTSNLFREAMRNHREVVVWRGRKHCFRPFASWFKATKFHSGPNPLDWSNG